MRLNFDIIYEALKQEFDITRYGQAKEELNIKAPRFLTGEERDHYIYIFNYKEFPENLSAPAICVDHADDMSDVSNVTSVNLQDISYDSLDYPIMVIHNKESVKKVMNAVLKIFDDFHTWDESLQEALQNQMDLRELAGRAASMLECRVLISDKNFVLLADSKYYREEGDIPTDYQGDVLPNAVIKKICEESKYHRKRSQTPYFAGEDGRYDGSLVYNMDIFLGDRYEGTCSLMESERTFKNRDFALFLHFFQYVRKTFQFYNGTKGKKSRALRMVMKDLLHEKKISSTLQQEIDNYNKQFCNYRCVVICHEKKGGLPYDYLNMTLESLYDGCVSVYHDDKVVSIIPDMEERKVNQLFLQLAHLNIVFGISSFGERLDDCHNLYLQAVNAIEVGQKENPEQKLYFFERYLLPYVVKNGTRFLPIKFLQTEGMRRLEAYNKESMVDYIDTLRVYLDQEMNITETSKILFLHRSTFLKRLERLQRILKEELENPEGRLLLRLQLYYRNRR